MNSYPLPLQDPGKPRALDHAGTPLFCRDYGNRTDRLWMRAIRGTKILRDDNIVDPHFRGDYGDYRSQPAKRGPDQGKPAADDRSAR